MSNVLKASVSRAASWCSATSNYGVNGK